MPTPENGQTHPNNSSVVADEWPFSGMVHKGLSNCFYPHW